MAIKSALNQPPAEFGSPLFEYRPSRLLGVIGLVLIVFQVVLVAGAWLASWPHACWQTTMPA